jgi:hypothetical protein
MEIFYKKVYNILFREIERKFINQNQNNKNNEKNILNSSHEFV